MRKGIKGKSQNASFLYYLLLKTYNILNKYLPSFIFNHQPQKSSKMMSKIPGRY